MAPKGYTSMHITIEVKWDDDDAGHALSRKFLHKALELEGLSEYRRLELSTAFEEPAPYSF